MRNKGRGLLLALKPKETVAARKLRRAQSQLLADDERPDEAQYLGRATSERVRKRFVEDGLEAALTRLVARRSGPARCLDPEAGILCDDQRDLAGCAQTRPHWCLLIAERLP